MNVDDNLACFEVQGDFSDQPRTLDAEDLGVQVFVSHAGHSRPILLRYPHEIRKRQVIIGSTGSPSFGVKRLRSGRMMEKGHKQ